MPRRVRRAIEIAKERGAGASVELKVSAPFHSPLMQPARDGMEPVIAALQVTPFRFGVIANVTAEVNRDPARVKPLLLEQITAPVRWEESMARLAASGATRRARVRRGPRAGGSDAAYQQGLQGAIGGRCGLVAGVRPGAGEEAAQST